jgi:thiamine biosynthesis lipoprotein
MHHIIDPSTGVPTANGIAAVVVAARSAWWAEGIAKAMIVAGRESVETLARRAGVRAWCFLDDGSSFATAAQPGPA